MGDQRKPTVTPRLVGGLVKSSVGTVHTRLVDRELGIQYYDPRLPYLERCRIRGVERVGVYVGAI